MLHQILVKTNIYLNNLMPIVMFLFFKHAGLRLLWQIASFMKLNMALAEFLLPFYNISLVSILKIIVYIKTV